MIISLLVLQISQAFTQELVHFMSGTPIIDGVADNNEIINQLKPFEIVEKTNKNNAEIDVKYSLAYGASFLYLYLEIDDDQLITRDRAYQNGDGFLMSISKPQADGSDATEFNVLAFSPNEKAWGHKRIWRSNFDMGIVPPKLRDEVQLKTKVGNNKVSMELLLPWQSTQPYHPWFSDSIGFNLRFTKAIGENERNHHYLKKDALIWSENPKRKYVELKFMPAQKINQIETSMISRNIPSNEYPEMKLAGFMEKDTNCTFRVNIYSGENALVSKQSIKKKYQKGFFSDTILLDKSMLIPGGYRIHVSEQNGQTRDHFISVLPNLKTLSLEKRLKACQSNISEGIFNTLSLYLEECKSALSTLFEYESSYHVRSSIEKIKNTIEKLENGEKPFENKKGVYRRAFVSEIDSSLRPYAVYVPKDYDGNKKYPLLVYLHGSSESEKSMFYTKVKVEEGFIMLAPNGRGTSNCYATDDAQTDINESIQDVIKNFNIDTDNIILSGFSMGGYGVYHTYHENPNRYKAIAILSGHPNIGKDYGYKEGIDFREKKNLKVFKGVPAFIFHGKQDLNCNYNLTEHLVSNLKKSGCEITFKTENIGHQTMNSENMKLYKEWLMNQVK